MGLWRGQAESINTLEIVIQEDESMEIKRHSSLGKCCHEIPLVSTNKNQASYNLRTFSWSKSQTLHQQVTWNHHRVPKYH